MRRHFNEIQSVFLCDPQCFPCGEYAKLFSIHPDQADFPSPDLPVDTLLFANYISPPEYLTEKKKPAPSTGF